MFIVIVNSEKRGSKIDKNVMSMYTELFQIKQLDNGRKEFFRKPAIAMTSYLYIVHI